MSTIDIALTNVDINQCDKSPEGTFQFEIFAGTHHCKNETTQVRILVTRASDLMSAHDPRLWETLCRRTCAVGFLKPNTGYLKITAPAHSS